MISQLLLACQSFIITCARMPPLKRNLKLSLDVVDIFAKTFLMSLLYDLNAPLIIRTALIINSSPLDSRSDTPNQSRKSPTSDMGVQTSQRSGGENQGPHKDKMQRNNNQRNNNNNNSYQQYHERRDSGRNDGYRVR